MERFRNRLAEADQRFDVLFRVCQDIRRGPPRAALAEDDDGGPAKFEHGFFRAARVALINGMNLHDTPSIYLTMNTTKDALQSAPGFKYDRQTTTWVPDNSKSDMSH